MSYTEAARRICSLLGLDKKKYMRSGEKGPESGGRDGGENTSCVSGAEPGRGPPQATSDGDFPVQAKKIPCSARNRKFCVTV